MTREEYMKLRQEAEAFCHQMVAVYPHGLTTEMQQQLAIALTIIRETNLFLGDRPMFPK